MSYPERPIRPNQSQGAGVSWLLIILLILVAGLLYRGQVSRPPMSPLHNPAVEEKPIVARGDLAEDEKSTIELFKKASPSVVHITNLAVQRDALSLDVTGIPQGTGSGFVWDQDGYIVTNFHVIESAQAAKVRLANHTEWDARLVGAAPDKDIAVLKIEAPREDLHPLAIGTSTNLQVGQKVFAIGNPFGLDQTLTTGIISRLGHEIQSVTRRPIQGVIQTDAAINPGNSGGPLLDSAGLVIGLNTAIFSPSGTNSGIGFAVPIDPIRWIVPQLIRNGKVERVGMGISIWDDSITARMGLQGVLVRTVTEGGPAEKAGIHPTVFEGPDQARPGDLIVSVNGKPVRSSIDLFRILDQFKAGDTITATVRYKGTSRDVSVTLAVLESPPS